MPLISYICECKHSDKKFYRRAKDAPATFLCKICGLAMKKALSVPSTSSKIVIDNGFQARAVEVIPDIVELNEQRSNKDYSTED